MIYHKKIELIITYKLYEYSIYKNTMKIAILGGSFNPIGNHHIDIIQQLYITVDEVWIMPCHKSTTGKKLESDEHRINMCNIAINKLNSSKIKLCLFEIENKLSGQTYDVMEKFCKLYENNKNYKFYFVIGMDNALTINTWDNWEKLINMIPFIILNRNGYNKESNEYWFTKLPHVYMKNIITQNESSTKIRNDIKNALTPNINPDVYKYIITNKLYTN